MGMAEQSLATRKAGLITKTLDRCRSTPVRQKPAEGCFSVTRLFQALFQALLDEAEEAFGYAAAGPLELPCDAEAFARVLEQIEEEKQRAAGLARRNSYGLLGTARPAVVSRS